MNKQTRKELGGESLVKQWSRVQGFRVSRQQTTKSEHLKDRNPIFPSCQVAKMAEASLPPLPTVAPA